MAVIRVQKTDNYTVMSNNHLRNKELSLKAKGLMSLMLSLPPQWDYSIGGLVAICKESHTSIRSALKELEQNQYLVRERKNNEKGYFTYEYTLYEIPEPHTEKQHTEKGHTEKRHTEKRPQINKDGVSKDVVKKDVVKKDIYNINNFLDILDTIPDPYLRNLYCYFLDNRNYMGAPLTRKGLELLIERVRDIAGIDTDKQKELLRTAVINNWKNVYPKGEQPVESEELNQLKNFYGK